MNLWGPLTCLILTCGYPSVESLTFFVGHPTSQGHMSWLWSDIVFYSVYRCVDIFNFKQWFPFWQCDLDLSKTVVDRAITLLLFDMDMVISSCTKMKTGTCQTETNQLINQNWNIAHLPRKKLLPVFWNSVCHKACWGARREITLCVILFVNALGLWNLSLLFSIWRGHSISA